MASAASEAGLRSRLLRIAGASRTPRADFGLAGFVLLFAAVIWMEAAKVPPPFFDPLGSAAVPQGIAIVFAVLAAIVALRAVLGLPDRVGRGVAGFRPRPDIAIGILVLAIAYVGVMQLRLIGFELATIAFLAVASALLGRFDRRVMLLGLLIALVLGVGGTWLFTGFFYIDLPR
ncbi:MAG TPA: tripartite tricarboxylate transporter TctB family protein [Falsiroseomonas sp.]|jgi:putative tricarboxylic transport membrane protein|nr:tripartite tricarboxylate transporter TctB family protein [Falsiroseomonas sp.]